jgi:hypothetical protein
MTRIRVVPKAPACADPTAFATLAGPLRSGAAASGNEGDLSSAQSQSASARNKPCTHE